MHKKIVGVLGTIALLLLASGAFAQKPVTAPLPRGYVKMDTKTKAKIEAEIKLENARINGKKYIRLHYVVGGKKHVYQQCEATTVGWDASNIDRLWAHKSCIDASIKRMHQLKDGRFLGWSVHYYDGKQIFWMSPSEWTYTVSKVFDGETNQFFQAYIYKRK